MILQIDKTEQETKQEEHGRSHYNMVIIPAKRVKSETKLYPFFTKARECDSP